MHKVQRNSIYWGFTSAPAKFFLLGFHFRPSRGYNLTTFGSNSLSNKRPVRLPQKSFF